MESKRNLLLLIGLLVVVMIVGIIAYNVLAPTVETQTLRSQGTTASGSADRDTQSAGETTDSVNEENIDAPDFTMTSADGEEITLESLEGKPLVLNFWASTCGPCKSEMPEFQNAYEEFGDRIQFVMVNIPGFNGETQARALQFLEQQGYSFPVYFDSDAEAQIQYGITSIPRTYFIDPDGTVEAYVSGAMDASTLERGIEMIL